jgi:hypothetical protein
MNDWYNDPPEEPEVPECCQDLMDLDPRSGVLTCPTCRKRIEPEPDVQDVEYPPDPPMHMCAACGEALPASWQYAACQECGQTARCRHGNLMGNCQPCDQASDQAYDAARENRLAR